MAQYIWPVRQGIGVNQAFGSSPGGVNPPGGHTGMDFGTEVGTPIYAPAAGVIEYAQWFTTDNGSDNQYWITSGGGITVVLGCDGDDAPSFVFSHLGSTAKNLGDRVKQGDVIGYSGNTGKWTSGPHCHFEAIPPGFNLNSPTYGRVNPARYCDGYLGNITKPLTGSKPTPIKEDTLSAAEVKEIKDYIHALAIGGYKSGGKNHPGFAMVAEENQRRIGAVAGQVWAAPVIRGGKKISALQELADTKTLAEKIRAENVALRAALAQLSAGTTIDYTKIGAEVSKALAEGVVQVDVTVAGAK